MSLWTSYPLWLVLCCSSCTVGRRSCSLPLWDLLSSYRRRLWLSLRFRWDRLNESFGFILLDLALQAWLSGRSCFHRRVRLQPGWMARSGNFRKKVTMASPDQRPWSTRLVLVYSVKSHLCRASLFVLIGSRASLRYSSWVAPWVVIFPSEQHRVGIVTFQCHWTACQEDFLRFDFLL